MERRVGCGRPVGTSRQRCTREAWSTPELGGKQEASSVVHTTRSHGHNEAVRSEVRGHKRNISFGLDPSRSYSTHRQDQTGNDKLAFAPTGSQTKSSNGLVE